MKLTKTKLKQIIKEELGKVLSEYGTSEYGQYAAAAPEVPNIEDIQAAGAAKAAELKSCKAKWDKFGKDTGLNLGRNIQDQGHSGLPSGWWEEQLVLAANAPCPEYATETVNQLRDAVEQWERNYI